MQRDNTTHFSILCIQELQEMTCQVTFNALRTGDADLRFYITTVQDG